MPIYEYACDPCRRIFQFLSKRVRPDAAPRCPLCGAPGLRRVPSTFAAGPRNRPEEKGSPKDDDALDARMESAFAEMAGELEHLDENDPRQMARVMRRLMEATGERPPGMEEALRRLEAGEDPEKVEEEMEGLLGEDAEDGDLEAEEGQSPGPPPAKNSSWRATWKRLRGPSRDPRLYPLEKYL